ncbi:NAD-dependent epimerase/dehydratase family protein [Thermodesulfobacteriota bacterium]
MSHSSTQHSDLCPQSCQPLNLLITGGCGFIGINLIRHILNQDKGYRIKVLDNLSVGTKEGLAQAGEFEETTGADIGETQQNQLELVVGDVRDEAMAKNVCRGVDAIVHLAANTGVIPSIEDPVTDCMNNVLGTLNYLEAARLNGVSRFIFASSGAPLGEQNPPIHEGMVPRPISPYGASKLSGEAYCSAYHGSFGVDTVALRFGNVYGPHSTHKGSVVAKFIRHILAKEPLAIFGDGNQTRDFIYVDDLTRAIVLALECPHVGGEIFQIATHKEHTVREVAVELNVLAEKFLGRKSEIVFEKERKGEVKRNFSDISKAKRMLGFEPKYDLKKGMEETFVWFMKES